MGNKSVILVQHMRDANAAQRHSTGPPRGSGGGFLIHEMHLFSFPKKFLNSQGLPLRFTKALRRLNDRLY